MYGLKIKAKFVILCSMMHDELLTRLLGWPDIWLMKRKIKAFNKWNRCFSWTWGKRNPKTPTNETHGLKVGNGNLGKYYYNSIWPERWSALIAAFPKAEGLFRVFLLSLTLFSLWPKLYLQLHHITFQSCWNFIFWDFSTLVKFYWK